VLDRGDPLPWRAIEHLHELVAVEGALQLLQRRLLLEAREMIAQPLHARGSSPLLVRPCRGDIRRHEIEQVGHEIADLEREAPYGTVRPGCRVIPRRPEMQ